MKVIQRCKLLSLFAIIMLLGACVGMEDSFFNEYTSTGSGGMSGLHSNECTSKTAYEIGRRDAMRNRAPISDYAANCMYNKRRINEAYAQGYTTGQNTHTQRNLHMRSLQQRRQQRIAQQQKAKKQGLFSRLTSPFSNNHQNQAQARRERSEMHIESSRDDTRTRDSGGSIGRPSINRTPSAPSLARRQAPRNQASANRSKPQTAPRGNGWRCLNVNGRKVCGYNCVRVGNHAKCADTASKKCVSTSTGKIACGFNCARSIKTVRCAQSRAQNCVADSFGNIRCGVNCRKSFNGVQCDN